MKFNPQRIWPMLALAQGAIGVLPSNAEAQSDIRSQAAYILALAVCVLPAQLLGAEPPREVTVTISGQIISDGVSLSNAKSVPSAIIEYTAVISNQGSEALSPDSLIITNPVPTGLMLYVGNIAGQNSGPVLFAEGTVPSQLTCTFEHLGEASDCLEFSDNDAESFGYRPNPDSDGFDAAVTHFRIRPTGAMAKASVQPSSCAIRYRMKVM